MSLRLSHLIFHTLRGASSFTAVPRSRESGFAPPDEKDYEMTLLEKQEDNWQHRPCTTGSKMHVEDIGQGPWCGMNCRNVMMVFGKGKIKKKGKIGQHEVAGHMSQLSGNACGGEESGERTQQQISPLSLSCNRAKGICSCPLGKSAQREGDDDVVGDSVLRVPGWGTIEG